MKKMELGVVTIMNLCMELRNKYGVEIKVRNYFRDEPPDPYFLFEDKPSEEVKEFVREYFWKEGGLVIFSDNGKAFIVCENWTALSNYHITLNSGEIGIEKCADIIRAVLT